MDELNEMTTSQEMMEGSDEQRRDYVKKQLEGMLADLHAITSEEEEIMACIELSLREQGFKYICDTNQFILFFSKDNKPLRMHIFFQKGLILYKLFFPFPVQTNTAAVVCMYMARFNNNNFFSKMNLDLDDGELSMEYSYIIDNHLKFSKDEFITYLFSLIGPSLDQYVTISHLSSGIIPDDIREEYQPLLEKSLSSLNGDFDNSNVTYGITTSDDPENI